MVENAGFIRDGVETRTYLQTKKGLNYFYPKRSSLYSRKQPHENCGVIKEMNSITL